MFLTFGFRKLPGFVCSSPWVALASLACHSDGRPRSLTSGDVTGSQLGPHFAPPACHKDMEALEAVAGRVLHPGLQPLTRGPAPAEREGQERVPVTASVPPTSACGVTWLGAQTKHCGLSQVSA